MAHFILQQFIFFLTLALVLFLPGYGLLFSFFPSRKSFFQIERFILSFGLSILVIDFIFLVLNKLEIPIVRTSLLVSIFLLVLISFLIFLVRKQKASPEKNHPTVFSKKQMLLIISILLLSISIKTIYITDNIVPSSTDLGHHMYWVKEIKESKKIPNYEKRDIISSGSQYSISKPQNISDFIIGEHLIFAGISIISGIEVISYFPVVTLLSIDIMTLLAIFILTLRLFEKNAEGKNIAIAALFFIGPIFAIAPPQAKFVSGGVIGNIIGNFLVPVAFYWLIRALREKNSLMLMFSILFSMGLFYTHHLTGLIFLLFIFFGIIATAVFNIKNIKKIIIDWLKLFFSIPVLTFTVFAAVFLFGVYTPTYLTNKAVNTVVGGPSKTDHVGLPYPQVKSIMGEPRFALGIIGVFLLLFLSAKLRKNNEQDENYYFLFLLSWIFVILVISIKPTLLFLDIPSSRVANYGSYPLAILAGFLLVSILKYIRTDIKFNISRRLFVSSFLLLITYVFTSGYFDSAQYMEDNFSAQKAVQTFHASQYLSERINEKDQVASDHVYTTADSWMKLFFMRDYNFPLYRANFERYENGIDKNEKCTLGFISNPSSIETEKCFSDLGVNFIIVNKIDTAQFRKDTRFSEVYSNNEISIFYRK